MEDGLSGTVGLPAARSVQRLKMMEKCVLAIILMRKNLIVTEGLQR